MCTRHDTTDDAGLFDSYIDRCDSNTWSNLPDIVRSGTATNLVCSCFDADLLSIKSSVLKGKSTSMLQRHKIYNIADFFVRLYLIWQLQERRKIKLRWKRKWGWGIPKVEQKNPTHSSNGRSHGAWKLTDHTYLENNWLEDCSIDLPCEQRTQMTGKQSGSEELGHRKSAENWHDEWSEKQQMLETSMYGGHKNICQTSICKTNSKKQHPVYEVEVQECCTKLSQQASSFDAEPYPREREGERGDSNTPWLVWSWICRGEDTLLELGNFWTGRGCQCAVRFSN